MKRWPAVLLVLCVGAAWAHAQENVFLVDGIDAEASDTLADPADPAEASLQRTGRYSVRNLFDGRPDTAWAAGRGGVGVKLLMALPWNAAAVTVINGFARDKKLFLANNRVKAFKAALFAGYSGREGITEIGRRYTTLAAGISKPVALQDAMEPQTLVLPFDRGTIDALFTRCVESASAGLDAPEDIASAVTGPALVLILSLEIVEIYPGGKYNDTCLSELKRTAPASPADADLAGGWRALASDLAAEEILFGVDDEDGEHRFYSFLSERPFDNGRWRLLGDRLIVTTVSGVNLYSGVALNKDRLTFRNRSKETQQFQKIK